MDEPEGLSPAPAGRDLPAQRQIEAGQIDAGTRGAVTGGKHLRPLEDAVAELFAPLVQRGAEVRSGARLTLPGHYRRSKDWDLLVTFKGALVAAIEFKSQVGSIGTTSTTEPRKLSVTPSTSGKKIDPGTLYPADPVFSGTSYIDRYRLLAQRPVRERLYDATCVLTTRKGEGILEEPVAEVSVASFAAAVNGRIAYIEALNI